MLRRVLARAFSYNWMNAVARGPGVLAVGTGGGGEGEASWEEEADGIVVLFELVWKRLGFRGAGRIEGGVLFTRIDGGVGV